MTVNTQIVGYSGPGMQVSCGGFWNTNLTTPQLAKVMGKTDAEVSCSMQAQPTYKTVAGQNPKQGYVVHRVQTHGDNTLGCQVLPTTTDNTCFIVAVTVPGLPAGRLVYHCEDDPGSGDLCPKMLSAALHPWCDAQSSSFSINEERRIFCRNGTYDIYVTRYDNWPTTSNGEVINHDPLTSVPPYSSRHIWTPTNGPGGPGLVYAVTGVVGPGSGTAALRNYTLGIEGADFV